MGSSPIEPVKSSQTFQWLNRNGQSPGLIVCDHASNRIPDGYDGLGLNSAARIAWDVGVAALAALLSNYFEMSAILTSYSRLFIDCNRTLDHPELIPLESDGVSIPGSRNLSAAEMTKRRADCYEPYHAAVESWLNSRLAQGRIPCLLSIHSMTKQMRGQPDRPWDICVLWNRDGRIAKPLLAALRDDSVDFTIDDNEPYSARIHAGATIPRHAEARGLPHVIFEIRNDRLASSDELIRVADTLKRALDPVLSDSALYAVRQF